jgi:hypothetical protein
MIVFPFPQTSPYPFATIMVRRGAPVAPAPSVPAHGAFLVQSALQQSPYPFGWLRMGRVNPVPPPPGLIINRTLHSVVIRTQTEPTPWSIDPERTQQIE